MTRSHRLSSVSVSCRLEWRPSRWVIGALFVLGMLAAFSVLASAMPRWAAWPLSVATLAYAAWQARREWRLSRHELFFPGNDLSVTLDGQSIGNVELRWRGPMAFLLWQDPRGRPMRLSWWPDTLPAARRRELRLAGGSLDAAQNHRRMAP